MSNKTEKIDKLSTPADRKQLKKRTARKERRRIVAALYVDKTGCYSGLEGVEVWDITRDARLYAGPHPIVAHPPCQRWGPVLARLSTQAPSIQERGRCRMLCSGPGRCPDLWRSPGAPEGFSRLGAFQSQ